MNPSALASLPLLRILLLLPLVFAAGLIAVPDPRAARRLALLGAGLELVLALAVVAAGDWALPGLQFEERHEWIPSLNVAWHLGVDGLSAPMLPLTALLGVAVLALSPVTTRPTYALLLALESLTLGVFVAQDLVVFFLFWELSLVPVYFLVAMTGTGPRRRFAAQKYMMFMLAGGLPLLFGILVVGVGHASASGLPGLAGLSFDLPTLVATPLPVPTQRVVFGLLALGFAFKAPSFPLHSWLPTVAEEGSFAVAAWMVGLKVGVYGLLRVAFPLAPEAVLRYGWLLGALGVVGLVYGALLALQERGLRRLIAWTSMSHVGGMLVGLASHNAQGFQGVSFQLVSLGLVSGGAMLLVGALHQRLGVTDTDALGGLARPAPRLAGLFGLLCFASVGLPGTTGFVSEHLILVAAVRAHAALALGVALGAILSAAATLSAFQRGFLGPIPRVALADLPDLLPRERAVGLVFAALVVLGGLWPAPLLRCSTAFSDLLIAQIEGDVVEVDRVRIGDVADPQGGDLRVGGEVLKLR